MHTLKCNELGHYVPAFFEMHVDTEKDYIRFSEMSHKEITILFHEYIHFLQDFATCHGLNNLYVISEYLNSVANRIVEQNLKEFTIPFEIKDNDDNVLLNQLLLRYTNGDSQTSNKYCINDIIVEDWPLDAPEVKNPQIKSISCVTLNPNGDMKSFGALAIMESMAYLMERCCSPNDYEKSPEFPYLSADMVADYYVPSFSYEPLMVLALCDMCLQHYNPGVCFVHTMKDIRDGILKFDSPKEIYDYFYDFNRRKLKGEKCSLIDRFKSFADQTKKCFKSYMQNLPITPTYHAWIDIMFDFAIDWRENNRYFLLDMARCDNLSYNKPWISTVNKIGTPLISIGNKLNNYFLIPPDGMGTYNAVIYIKALREIHKVFSEGSCMCSMYNWCNEKDSDIIPNELCRIAPWRRVSDRKQCPFTYMWTHWNLLGREPKPKVK